MSKKTLTVFTLAMINVAAVSSVRNLPTIAEYGFASLFFFALAAVLFFIPVSMVAAELATGWPQTGGVFAWVKEAFGHRTGFLAIWLLWAENVIYYPALLSFIAGTIAYIASPTLAQNPYYTLFVIVTVFWATTLANLLGMRISGWISAFGVITGTIIPGGLIIILGILWYFSGNSLQVAFTTQNLVPDMSSPTQLVLFSGVLVAFCGLEMSAVHARDVQNPQKNYPRAILLSALLILGLYVLGVLAIAIVIPQSEISLTAGSLQAFAVFVDAYGLSWLTPVIAILLTLGAFGTLSTWIAGPSKGLLGAAQSGDLPPFFRKLNRHGMPVALLITQAVIVTFFSMIFFNHAHCKQRLLGLERHGSPALPLDVHPHVCRRHQTALQTAASKKSVQNSWRQLWYVVCGRAWTHRLFCHILHWFLSSCTTANWQRNFLCRLPILECRHCVHRTFRYPYV